VIPSQKEKIFGVLYFIAKQKSNSFYRLLTAVDIVAKEKVVSFRWKTSILKNPQKVITPKTPKPHKEEKFQVKECLGKLMVHLCAKIYKKYAYFPWHKDGNLLL